jgi:hypothetical protein
MDAKGLAGGPTRPPRMPLTVEESRALDAALKVLEGVPA